MAARIEALEVEKREKGVLMQTTVSEKDHLIAKLETDVHRLESANCRAEKELEVLKDALSQANSSEIIMKSKLSALEVSAFALFDFRLWAKSYRRFSKIVSLPLDLINRR